MQGPHQHVEKACSGTCGNSDNCWTLVFLHQLVFAFFFDAILILSVHTADYFFFETSIDPANYQQELLSGSFYRWKSDGGNRSAAEQNRRLIYYEQDLGFHGRSGMLVEVFEPLPKSVSS